MPVRQTSAYLFVCFTAVVFSTAGCGGISTTDEEHHEHSHDEHHASFPESVAEIQSHVKMLVESTEGAADSAAFPSNCQRLIEVIQHLPEVAADTDLRKRDWERVEAISKELLTILQSDAAMSGKTHSGVAGPINPLIDELKSLVPLSDSRISLSDDTKPKD
ncbi:MAG: hypothetical protein U0941_22055 [Planctomycetaceae bacterium]